MQMTNGEIVADYKQAKDKKKQIAIRADLNGCKEEVIREILKNGGIDGRSLPRQGEKKMKKKKEDAPAQESAAPEGSALASAGTSEGEGDCPCKKPDGSPAQRVPAGEERPANVWSPPLAGDGTGMSREVTRLVIEERELLDRLVDIYLSAGYGVFVRPVKGREAWIVGALPGMEEET